VACGLYTSLGDVQLMDTRPRLLTIMLATAGALAGAFGLLAGARAFAAAGLLACVAAAAIAILSRPRGFPAAPSRVVGPPESVASRDEPTAALEPDMASSAPPLASATAELPAATPPIPPRATPAVGPCGPPLSVAPLSAEPIDVVAALAHNAAAAGEVLSAHLWLEDSPSATLRLITAWGPQRPSFDPVDIQSSTLGRALSSGSAALRAEFEQTTTDGSVGKRGTAR